MNNADKIQAALLCVQALVGIVQVVTTFFFIRSVRITGRQENDAREQIDLARDQMRLTSSQYRESLRPLIVVSSNTVGSNFYELAIRNDGQGPALQIKCEPAISMQSTIIGSKSAVAAYVRKPQNQNEPYTQFFTLTYRSIDGHNYVTSFHQQKGEFSVVDYRDLDSEQDRAEAQGFREGFIAGAR